MGVVDASRVNMCTVWPSHLKWLRKQSNESTPNFVLSLNILLRKLFGWFRRPQLWATGDWQLHHNTPAHASHLMQSFFGKTSNHPSDSAPLQPTFGTLLLLPLTKTKITFEREEISDRQWDSGAYNGEDSGDWENCARSQGAYFEGTEVLLSYAQCFLYLHQ